MRQALFVILTALVIVCGTDALSLAEISLTIPELAIDPAGIMCEIASTPSGDHAGVIILAQSQKQKKYTCLETCAKDRYICERKDKNKPGSKANIQASSKCQLTYISCLDKCQ